VFGAIGPVFYGDLIGNGADASKAVAARFLPSPRSVRRPMTEQLK
jgi:hypothetical protein